MKDNSVIFKIYVRYKNTNKIPLNYLNLSYKIIGIRFTKTVSIIMKIVYDFLKIYSFVPVNETKFNVKCRIYFALEITRFMRFSNVGITKSKICENVSK